VLLARLHSELKNFTDSLICLNNASKVSKYKIPKPVEPFWKLFEELGKAKPVLTGDPLSFYPRLNIKS
jgi:hypothetical protein